MANISSLIQELLYAPGKEQLVFSSAISLIENMNEFELYSIDLRNPSLLTKLTKSKGFETHLKISEDKQHLTFVSSTYRATPQISNNSQSTICSLDLTTRQITRLAKNFDGSIDEYTITSDGAIYFIGQLGTELQIYAHRPISDEIIPLRGWNESYYSIVSSRQNSFAFVHSSTDKPMEIYLASNID